MSTSKESDPSKNLNQFNKFLENNTEFLTQKYTQHFIEAFVLSQLQTKSKIESAIKFIYDVFSFEKYERDEKMNLTLKKSLRENVLGFLKEQSGKQGKKFTAEYGIKLLKYCIENNEMFAVHYDKKEKKQQEQPVQKEQQPNEEEQQNNQQETNEKEQLQQPQPQQQQPQNTTDSKLQPNQSHVSQNGKNLQGEQSQPLVTNNNNQFALLNKTEEEKKRNQTLKKEAKIVFDFYCKQQLNNGGPNATFDKILHEANTMTLGKFMAFANTTKILYTTKVQSYKPKDHLVLDKKTINEKFRKVSRTQKEIDFDQFFELLKTLHQVDSTVYQKLNMDKSQTHNKILKRLKYLSTPFNMKGHLEEQAHLISDEKPFVPISTLHSGRFQSSLKEDMVERRMKLRLLPYQPYPNQNQIKAHQTFMQESKINNFQTDLLGSKIRGGSRFLLDNRGQSKTHTDDRKQLSKIRLQNSRVSFDNGKMFSDQIQVLHNLIVYDENDDEFLKDYKIPKLNSNAGLKKKTNNLSVTNRDVQETQKSARKFSGLKTQRKNVVGELKQRIKEVENSERKQLTGLQNKRRAVSNASKY